MHKHKHLNLGAMGLNKRFLKKRRVSKDDLKELSFPLFCDNFLVECFCCVKYH